MHLIIRQPKCEKCLSEPSEEYGVEGGSLTPDTSPLRLAQQDIFGTMNPFHKIVAEVLVD